MSTIIKAQISKKVNYLFKKYESANVGTITKPEFKLFKDLIFGLMKSQSPIVNSINRKLEEPISLKHTEKRLRRHLGKRDLEQRFQEVFLKANKNTLKTSQFIIVDDSDIVKEYSNIMENLANVRDGDKHIIKKGYHILNGFAVSSDGENCSPVYSELYSTLEKDFKSGNEKILKMHRLISKYKSLNPLISVHDRGFDRGKLFIPAIENDDYFICRLNEKRYLRKNDKTFKPQDWKNIELTNSCIANHITKSGKIKKTKYLVGIISVELPNKKVIGKKLWLLVSKKTGTRIKDDQGFSYYLAYLPEKITGAEALETIFRGYGYRWKIEEYHRFLKSELHYEKMCLQRYSALKIMNVLMMIFSSFIFKGLKRILFKFISLDLSKKEFKRLFSEKPLFIYYKLAKALKKLTTSMKLYELKTEALKENIPTLFDYMESGGVV
ncbi:transposase [Candidatus Dependentiae bacterium]|nr:transposase [Candidatus Dependentiae bacterium]